MGRVTTQYKASEKLSLQGGVEFRDDRSTGQRILGHPAISDYSAFVSAEYRPIAAMNIRPGLRFSKNSIYDAPPVVPALNVKVALDARTDLRVSYARGFRAPALRELYFTFHDANHDINGNPDLKAEYSNSYQVSVTHTRSLAGGWEVSGTVSGFYNDYHNFIGLAPGDNNQYYYFNLDHNKTTGGTVEARLAGKGLEAVFGFSYIGIYNKYASDTAYKGSGVPDWAFGPEATANISKSWKSIGLTTSLFYKYTGRQPTYEVVSSGSQQLVHVAKMGAFSMADFTVIKTLGPLVSVNAGVRNLFDVKKIVNNTANTGAAHASGTELLKNYGRSYFLGLAFQWKQKSTTPSIQQ